MLDSRNSRGIYTIGEYNKIKVGVKTLDDAVLNLGAYRTCFPKVPFANKPAIYKALAENDLPTLRRISEFFYNTSGLYQRAVNYFAYMYRYDWLIAAEETVTDDNKKQAKTKDIEKDFKDMLHWLDNSYIKKMCGEIALHVIKTGAYYCYVIDDKDRISLQQLPNEYCRTRYSVAGMPAIGFNMQYFDTFRDAQYRAKILKLFPKEFQEGYVLFKRGKLQPDYYGDPGGWYLLTPGRAFKFNFNNSDIPVLVNAIPSILDLDSAQDLDRRKQMQQLLKILVQKLPMDKNGDLIFDVDEARDIHNNAVAMLQRAIGVDVLTTFADVESIDMSDKNTTTTTDDLKKIERTVYNNMGVSQSLFNTDGNLALEKSILNDESNVRNLLLQFQIFFDKMLQDKIPNKKKYRFHFYLLETTQYNYQNLAKFYKENTQLGFSKTLPQVAMGLSQSFVLNTAYFENEVLKLAEMMLPNLMSSTMNLTALLGQNQQNNQNKNQNNSEQKKDNNVSQTTTKKQSSGQSGRPEKDDDQKSEKTIQNKESMK